MMAITEDRRFAGGANTCLAFVGTDRVSVHACRHRAEYGATLPDHDRTRHPDGALVGHGPRPVVRRLESHRTKLPLATVPVPYAVA